MRNARTEIHAIADDRRLWLIAVGVAAVISLLAVWLAASPAKAAPVRSSAAGATVKLAKSKLGSILTDSRGRTLYLFEKDKKSGSACYGQCARYWPPVLSTGKPVAGPGVNRSLLGLVTRKGGTHQVVYAGHPLYRFFQDKAPGQTTGEGLSFFGGNWYVLASSGRKIDKDSADKSSSPGTTTTTPGGYGGG
jgi:predicted lipoprotein with Yx(FWY)xxD motif